MITVFWFALALIATAALSAAVTFWQVRRFWQFHGMLFGAKTLVQSGLAEPRALELMRQLLVRERAGRWVQRVFSAPDTCP
jgi:hypothetical protein